MREVTKSFARKFEIGTKRSTSRPITVLKNVNLAVKRGGIVCIIGKNGCGKTTLIRIASTLLLADSGKVLIMGFDAQRDGREIRRIIGVMLNNGSSIFYPRFSALSNLKYYAALSHVPMQVAIPRIHRLMKDLGVEEPESRQVQSYSTGMRRRLSLARALLADPSVLLLDEPTVGVDPWTISSIHEQLKSLSEEDGKTILVTTNNLAEAKTLGDDVLQLEDGNLIPST